MRGKSLPEMIDQFVSYKKANGYQYQAGAYYLKKYARFAIETAPETVYLVENPTIRPEGRCQLLRLTSL